MPDTRRKGDARPYHHDATLMFGPQSPMRWLPRHGRPYCVIEWATQHSIRRLATFPAYAALILLLTLIVFAVVGGH